MNDLTIPYLVHQPICNLCGMMCCIAMLNFLLSLPGFLEFFVSHSWTEFFKVGIVAASFIAYGHTRDQHRKRIVEPMDEATENPDNYLPTRVHVWANAVHLVWTVSLLMILALGFVACGIAMWRTMGMPLLVLWPFAQGMLFFWYASASKPAKRIHATAVGLLFPGVACTSAGFAALALLL